SPSPMFGEVTFAVLGVLFLIYDVRTFASTFQQTFYGQANTTLALLAGGVFATSLLAPIVGWRLGPRRSVGLGAAMLGISPFLAAGLISIGAQRGWTRPGLRGAVAIAALPALLLVAETGGTNGAQIALAGGLGYGTEGRSTELALVLVGLGLAAGTLLLTRPH